MNARRAAAASLACLVLFAFIMHWPVFLQGKTVSAFDLSYFQFIAYRAHRPPDVKRTSNGLLSDCVLQFNVWDKAAYDGPLTPPWLWNPHAACGSPFLANGQSAPFYPLKAVAYGLAGVVRGFGFLCFLKMLAAGLFMWLYLRALGAGAVARTLGGIAFMASGFMIAWLQGPHTSAALALPLLLLGCERLLQRKLRRGFLVVAVATAFSLLGGHPETTFHMTLAAAVYVVGRLLFAGLARQRASFSSRHAFACVAVLILAILLGAMIAAVQVAPSMEYILHGATLTRRAEATAVPDDASVFSLGNTQYIYHSLLAYLVPNAWGNPSAHDHWWSRHGNFHSYAGYIGIGGVLLALFAWRYFLSSRTIGILCVLQLLSLGFALKLPLLGRTLGQLPLLNVAANQQFLLIYCFTSAALAALALEQLLSTQKLARVDVIWLALLGVLFMAIVTRDYARRFSSNLYHWIQAYGRRQLVHGLVFLIPWFTVLLLAKVRASIRHVVCAGLVGLLAADLYLIYFGYNPFIKPEQIYPETPALEFLEAEPSPARVLPVAAEIGPNVLTLYGLQDPRIFDAVTYAPYAGFLARLGSDGPWNLVEEPNERFASIASVRYFLTRPEWTPRETEGVELRYEDEVAKIYERRDALPLAYVSYQWRLVTSPEAAYDLLAQQDFSWQSTVAIEPQEGVEIPSAPQGERRLPSPATLVEHLPHSVTVELRNESSGLLVLNDCYFPGWQAYVGGEKRSIFRVNGTFRGVFIHESEKQVLFRYCPTSFNYGVVLSIAGIATLAAVALPIPKRFQRKRAVKDQ